MWSFLAALYVSNCGEHTNVILCFLHTIYKLQNNVRDTFVMMGIQYGANIL